MKNKKKIFFIAFNPLLCEGCFHYTCYEAKEKKNNNFLGGFLIFEL